MKKSSGEAVEGQLEDYWSSDPLLGVPGTVHGMPIDRFKFIL